MRGAHWHRWHRSGLCPAASGTVGTAGDSSSEAAVLGAERSLLFVAGTRVREDLAISWRGECSPLLKSAVTTLDGRSHAYTLQ